MGVLAKIKAYGLEKNKNGITQASITFEFLEGERMKNISWFGSLKEGKAQEITLKTIYDICEYGYPSLEEFANCVGLNVEKDYELEFKVEEYNGKLYEKVSWVNNVHRRDYITGSEVNQTVESIPGLKDACSRFSKGKVPVAQKPLVQGNINYTSDDIPF